MMRGQTETRGNCQDDLNGDQETTEKRTGAVPNCRETSEGRWRRANAGVYINHPHHALTVITGNADPSLVTQGWVSK
jgi:hypothetical protein